MEKKIIIAKKKSLKFHKWNNKNILKTIHSKIHDIPENLRAFFIKT